MTDDKQTTDIIRDPTKANSRIFIGNLPLCTNEELESICMPYGKVLATLVQKNFGFVQFESKEVANKAASALKKSTFKGNTITVRNAGAAKKNQPNPPQNNNKAPKIWQQQGQPNNTVGGLPMANTDQSNYNDCEIIVVDRKNT